jgi:hypothetical protein
MFPDSILNMTALAFLGLTIPMASATERVSTQCIPILPGYADKGALTPDAGGFSETTKEHLERSAAYLTAHVERADGKTHPAFDAEPRDIIILVTTGGRHVIRILDPRNLTGNRAEVRGN